MKISFLYDGPPLLGLFRGTAGKDFFRLLSAASSGPRWARILFKNFHFNWGGVKGTHPLGCLPLWGREGVTIVIRKILRYQMWFSPAATE